MIVPIDHETERKLREIAIGKAVPAMQRDAFAAGDPVKVYPDQIMSALRSAYLLNRRDEGRPK
jgi:hypothetical protein